jgi:hypothetical protein
MKDAKGMPSGKSDGFSEKGLKRGGIGVSSRKIFSNKGEW